MEDIYIGTYTQQESRGIHHYRFDPDSMSVEKISSYEVPNPSFLAYSPDRSVIYAVSEESGDGAILWAFGRDPETGELSLLDSVNVRGDNPVYISLSKDGKHIVTANYGNGSLSVFPLDEKGIIGPISQYIEFTGSGPDPERQDHSYLHSAVFCHCGKWLYAADLGADRIYRFRVNRPDSGQLLDISSLTQYTVPSGSGPRHIRFHPCGRFMYLINELSGTLVTYSFEKGEIEQLDIHPTDEVHPSGGAEIEITSDGRYLYASNRLGNDGVAVFSLGDHPHSPERLHYHPTGIHPRHIKITPDGRLLVVANKDSDSVEFYRIEENGSLHKLPAEINIPQPVFILM